ncbi:MAG: hypothetical protein ACK52P_12605 [Alphaproteobacteria bacterium]|jgi:hypothetical protein
MRWDPYVLARGAEFENFWRGHLATRARRRVLLVLGRGFDVRTLEAARRLKAAGADLRAWNLAFDTGLGESDLRTALTTANDLNLNALLGQDRVELSRIAMGGPAGASVTSPNTRRVIGERTDILDFDDIVVDISAMPRMVALTTVAKLLNDLDKAAAEGRGRVNLHVTVAESVSADLGAARGTLRDTVSMVQGFSGKLNAQGTETWPRVWLPVLGEGQRERLELIHGFLDPDEICPVVPFPSREPRRGDEILAEHRGVLFDDFQVEPSNILLASEYNPFEAYKQIFLAMDRYRRALNVLGGCKAFVSPVSSKLLSIGVLLACYDHRAGNVQGQRLDVGIPYVETADYGDPVQNSAEPFELFSMWIRGEWEDSLLVSRVSAYGSKLAI